MSCPLCHSRRIHRSKRKGIMERGLSSGRFAAKDATSDSFGGHSKQMPIHPSGNDFLIWIRPFRMSFLATAQGSRPLRCSCRPSGFSRSLLLRVLSRKPTAPTHTAAAQYPAMTSLG